jgi:NAD(P)H-dependent flavin oxidoreductase YrpB (nitropropane dioxygenase family)
MTGAGLPPPTIRTSLCDLVGCRYPIVQTGMGFVAGSRLAAAASEAGALGIIASATMSLPELAAAITDTKRRTNRPFGVNLRADQSDVGERADLMIREGVKVASFAMAPSRELVERFASNGLVTIASVGAVRHAQKVAGWGVDAVIVQGGEGGGHTGRVPTSILLPQVLDAVELPVIAAGGFWDGRGLAAALSYGAAGIAMGTRFLLTSDSDVPDAIKQIYLAKSVDDTVVTSRVDGFPHRMIATDFVHQVEKAGGVRSLARAARNALRFKQLTGTSWRALATEGWALRRQQGYSWEGVVMAANAPMLCRAAMVDGRSDIGILSSGQVVGVIDQILSCDEVVRDVMMQANAALTRLGELSAAGQFLDRPAG